MASHTQNDREKAAGIIRDAGGKLTGRTRLQKIAYLLEVAGLGDGFEFEYRHYGPYSEQLAAAISIAATTGLISEEEHSTNWGGTYSVFTDLSPRSAKSVDATRIAVIGQVRNADPVALELAATAAFLAQEGESDPWGETARRKPEKALRLEEAKSLYRKLQAVKTPKPLPQILQ